MMMMMIFVIAYMQAEAAAGETRVKEELIRVIGKEREIQRGNIKFAMEWQRESRSDLCRGIKLSLIKSRTEKDG